MSAWDSKEYWIFCDESVQEGPKFSHFFGGAIVPTELHADIENRLRKRKAEIGFLSELKWQRVTEHWLGGYKQMITAFFDSLRDGQARMRVMFCDNDTLPGGRTRRDRETGYFKLYYQFIKHAFGLKHMPVRDEGTRLRLFFDQFPHTREHVVQFKGFLGAMPSAAELRHARILIDPSHMAEIDSKEHVLLQCVDLVVGAMAFRLNDLHLAKPEGQRTRGKRTIAKEKLYKHILAEARTMKPHLNPKISTAAEPYPDGRWSMPYRHWSFRRRGT